MDETQEQMHAEGCTCPDCEGAAQRKRAKRTMLLVGASALLGLAIPLAITFTVLALQEPDASASPAVVPEQVADGGGGTAPMSAAEPAEPVLVALAETPAVSTVSNEGPTLFVDTGNGQITALPLGGGHEPAGSASKSGASHSGGSGGGGAAGATRSGSQRSAGGAAMGGVGGGSGGGSDAVAGSRSRGKIGETARSGSPEPIAAAGEPITAAGEPTSGLVPERRLAEVPQGSGEEAGPLEAPPSDPATAGGGGTPPGQEPAVVPLSQDPVKIASTEPEAGTPGELSEPPLLKLAGVPAPLSRISEEIINPVPEPGSLMLALLGLSALVFGRWARTGRQSA